MNTLAPHKLDFRRLLTKFKGLYRPFLFIGAYGIWICGFRLLALTFITYFTSSPTSRFQDINEVFSSNEVSLMGLASFLFVGFLCWLNPMTSTRLEEVISRDRIEKIFFPAFIRGSFFASGIVFAFVVGGVYKYLGYLIQFDEAPLALTNVVIRIVTVCALVYGEEFLFRYKLSKLLHGPSTLSILWTAIFYCTIKILQFDLGLMHLLTLFLISIYLSLQAQVAEEFPKGAGYWAAILIIFNPLLSLPIFGSEFAGVLLMRYQSIILNLTQSIEGTEGFNLNGLVRFFTGGMGGPISSFAFQLLLILGIGRSILKRKRKAL